MPEADVYRTIESSSLAQESASTWFAEFQRREEERLRPYYAKKEEAAQRKVARAFANGILRAWCTEHPDEAWRLAPLDLQPACPRDVKVPARDQPNREARDSRMKTILELRASGQTYGQIALHITRIDSDRLISWVRVRQLAETGLRHLRHPSRAAQLAEYERTGTFTSWD